MKDQKGSTYDVPDNTFIPFEFVNSNYDIMKTLHLTLKKQWFDLWFHPDPEKRKNEEYREIKPYWVNRLCDSHKGTMGGDLMDRHSVNSYSIKRFDNAFARNGYSKDAPSGKREVLGIEIGTGKPEWGAVPGKAYFVIKLGEIL